MPLSRDVRGVLLDIEGTTTPVSFVYQVLFPYAEARLGQACARAAAEPPLAAAVERLAEEFRAEPAAAAFDLDFGDGAPYARWLMAQDRKSTGLKALQGLIWEHGYRDGSLRAQVFPDVPPALAAWQNAGLRLRIYSSGSILAQKLLFAHTEYGDLTPRFEGYHDTTTGPKREADSYRRIAGAYALPPAAVLFLSDVAAELDAAAEAGIRTALVVRPGNQPVADAGPHPVVRSFESLMPGADGRLRSPLPPSAGGEG
jgi:enolase-phosphatase E1